MPRLAAWSLPKSLAASPSANSGVNRLAAELVTPSRSGVAMADRWRQWRNDLIADPRFQHWAARLPLVRHIAARRANALFDLCAGFVYSQTLFACVRMDVFERLAAGPREVADLAQGLGIDVAPMTRLLDAAVALDLLERRGPGRYGLGELGAALRGNPGVRAMIEHHELLYADLADPVAMLRERSPRTRLAQHWPYATTQDPQHLPAERVRQYTELMSASQPLVSQDVLAAYDFARHRCLLDVGGGDGTFLAAVAGRCPQLELQLFDLPGVATLATAKTAQLGLGKRIRCYGGSFRTDPLPRGADVVSLIRILHDHDDEIVRALLAAVRTALPPGGTVVIGEPLAGTPGAPAMGDAYFGLYLQAMGSGRPRTARELGGMLRECGFERIQDRPTARPLLASVLTARTKV
jgi:demethylspheroidene O-methyltransferase